MVLYYELNAMFYCKALDNLEACQPGESFAGWGLGKVLNIKHLWVWASIIHNIYSLYRL